MANDRSGYFTGRVDELAQLERLVLEHRSVCVVATGIGGIGKTTLVAEFVGARGPELFPDGVAWLDGSPEQFIGELGRVCRRFGWVGEREPTLDEAQAHLRASLASRRVLIVVDNFDPAKTAAGCVPIPGGASRTVITSRARALDVELGAKRLELGVWPLDACRTYLRARCERLASTPDAEVDALAEFVGRLPLGVELLVSVLRRRAGTPVAELLELLRAQPLGTLDKYDEDRGVAATFRVGYDDLPAAAREVLQALAVCARQTRRDVVAAVSARDDVGERLDELHARGFAELADDGAWGMHDVVRLFVLAQPGCEVFEQRHVAWVRAHLKARADPTAFRAFAKGVDEARLAFERLVASDLGQAMDIYRPLSNHLRAVGRDPEVMAVSERLLALAPPESPESGVALNDLGGCHRRLGDLPKAIELHERALALEQKLGQLAGQASQLAGLALCHLALGDIPKAIKLHEGSLALEQKLGRVAGQARELGNLGLIAKACGTREQARAHLLRARALFRQLNLPAGHPALAKVERALAELDPPTRA